MKTLTETARECALVDHELDRQFKEQGAIASERLRRHLDACEPCRDLYRWLREPSAEASASSESHPELYRNIQDVLRTSIPPVRALPSTGVLVLEFCAVLFLFAATATAMAGIAGFYQMDLAQRVGISVILLLSTALLSQSLVWQMIPGTFQRYGARTILLILAAGFLLGIGALFPWHAPEAFWARGRHCLGTGFLMSSLAAFMFWLFARRGAPQHSGTVGATLGGCAGLVSVTVLQLACGHQDLGHLLVWHGTVLVGSIMLGIGITQGIHSANRAR